MGQNDSVIRIDMNEGFWDELASILVGIVVAIAAVLLIAFTAGAAAAIAGIVIGATVTASIGTGAVLVSITAGVVAGVAFHSSMYPEDLVLPVYSISPEEIFKGQILLFDIDFFNPVQSIYARLDDGSSIEINNNQTDSELSDTIGDRTIECYFYPAEGNSVSDNYDDNDFNEKVQDGELIKTSKQNSALELQTLVSQWYNAIRNIAIVLSMSVLLYIGIRMLLSTVAQDKAKYKQMLIDWLVSLCLLFFMHYIMAFSVTLVKQFTKVVAASSNQSGSKATAYAAVLEEDEDGKIMEKMEDLGYYNPDDEENDYVEEGPNEDGDGTSKYVMWPTNLMGQLRIQAEMSYGDSSFIGYGICFFVLTILTIFFVFTYLKRVLYMAFLTMIAPLVALTYPIDKISDGQAQAFNKWLKEYVFNLLIQPLHLLIYTILVTSAFNLAGKNPIYSIVAIGFLIPAEKLMRSFFGFEKASTPPSMAGAAVGAGLFNTGLQRLLHGAPPGKGGKGGGNGANGLDGESGAPSRIGYNSNFDSEETLAKALGGGKDGDTNYEEDAMNKYKSEGYGQNANGDYFNPWTDEYDPDYDPLQDKEYNKGLGLSDGDDGGIGDTGDSGSLDSPRQYSIAGDLGRKFVNSKAGTPVRKIKGYAGSARKWVGGKARAIGNKVGNVKRGIQSNDKFRYLADSKEGQFIKGAGRAIKYTAKQGTRNAIRAARRTVGGAIAAAPNVAVRAAAGAALGATAGAIGVGAAVASGDPSNLITYGGGAAATAAAIAASRSGVDISNTKTAAQIARERQFYGDRYDQHVAEKNMKEWKKDVEKREEMEKYIGSVSTKDLYKGKSPVIDQYLKNEVTDVKDIATIEKMLKDGKIKSREEGIALQANIDKKGDLEKMKPKDREDWRKEDTEIYKKKGYSEQQATNMAQKQQDREIEYLQIRRKL